VANLSDLSLDFDNPLEPGYDDINLDPFETQDAKSALRFKNEAMDIFTRRNVFKGVDEYQGLVISGIKELNVNPGFIDKVFQVAGLEETRFSFKIHIPSLHSMLGNPCNVSGLSKSLSQPDKENLTKQIIQSHPDFITKALQQDKPEPGEWITVKFAKGPSGGRMIEGQIVRRLNAKIDLANPCNESLSEIVQNATSQLSENAGTNTTTPQVGIGINNETNLRFMYPFEGSFPVTSKLQVYRKIIVNGKDTSGPHTGVDFGMRVDIPMLASEDGIIKKADSSNGNLIISHFDDQTQKTYYTVYHHLNSITVRSGSSIIQGDIVGTSGNKGRSTGPHLHFEIRRNLTKPETSENSTPEQINNFYESCIDPLVGLSLPGRVGGYSQEEKSNAGFTQQESNELAESEFGSELNNEKVQETLEAEETE
jgi:hypothetical protein